MTQNVKSNLLYSYRGALIKACGILIDSCADDDDDEVDDDNEEHKRKPAAN